MVVKGCSCGGASLYTLCGTQRGAGFDGAQVTSFLRVCHHLLAWEMIGGARAGAKCEAETYSILSGLLRPYQEQGWVPSFWSRSSDCQARAGCVPSKCVPSFLPSLQPLSQRDKRGLCTLEKRSQTTGWLLTEVQATSNVPPVPAPAVASPTLHKRSFWYETPWSVTADHFSQPLLSLSC